MSEVKAEQDQTVKISNIIYPPRQRKYNRILVKNIAKVHRTTPKRVRKALDKNQPWAVWAMAESIKVNTHE